MPKHTDIEDSTSWTSWPRGETLGECLAFCARRAPKQTAFTVVGFGADGAEQPLSLTWGELAEQAGTVAVALHRRCAPGARVAVLASQSLEYVVGFLGAACAGTVAVPLFPPALPGHGQKLAAALHACRPEVVLTRRQEVGQLADFLSSAGLDCAVHAVEDLVGEEAPAQGLEGVTRPGPQDCAYLQYTSGSTRLPSGVEITHANVVANARQALEAYEVVGGRSHLVSWLPLYHDMGLLLMVAMAVVGGTSSVLMDPLAFVQQPMRWLRLLSRYPGAVTAAPNFAFDYCVDRVREQDRNELSLDGVAVMINGSEPVRAQTLARFHEAFGPVGLPRTAMRPSYGLAEATVFVAASPAGEEPAVTAFDRTALAAGRGQAGEPGGQAPVTELVGCGRPVGQEIAIVDPALCSRTPDGVVGEIWVHGPNVGLGYFGRREDSRAIFAAELAQDGPVADGNAWLRTGDLGLVHDKQLYVAGRIKDLVIVDGTNHYPQDIEVTVQEAHPAIRTDHVAAFAASGERGEHLVVVAEHAREVTEPDIVREAVTRAVRAAVAGAHAVSVHDFVLVPPNSVPRTTSGKVARSACREHYLTGGFGPAQAQPRPRSGEGA
ncbi:fatty acyl-AMP ligase [Streptomyces sp. NPDC046977]|uniref:fatty acyl-AMP ligase n=1 Tax=Streptomyces sp. NPDC046977 TaxID=3154703 RepID=UPI0033EFC7BA